MTEKKFKCRFCSTEEKSLTGLSLHIAIDHPTESKQIQRMLDDSKAKETSFDQVAEEGLGGRVGGGWRGVVTTQWGVA
jgi:hypothetical protein